MLKLNIKITVEPNHIANQDKHEFEPNVNRNTSDSAARQSGTTKMTREKRREPRYLKVYVPNF